MASTRPILVAPCEHKGEDKKDSDEQQQQKENDGKAKGKMESVQKAVSEGIKEAIRQMIEEVKEVGNVIDDQSENSEAPKKKKKALKRERGREASEVMGFCVAKNPHAHKRIKADEEPKPAPEELPEGHVLVVRSGREKIPVIDPEAKAIPIISNRYSVHLQREGSEGTEVGAMAGAEGGARGDTMEDDDGKEDKTDQEDQKRVEPIEAEEEEEDPKEDEKRAQNGATTADDVTATEASHAKLYATYEHTALTKRARKMASRTMPESATGALVHGMGKERFVHTALREGGGEVKKGSAGGGANQAMNRSEGGSKVVSAVGSQVGAHEDAILSKRPDLDAVLPAASNNPAVQDQREDNATTEYGKKHKKEKKQQAPIKIKRIAGFTTRRRRRREEREANGFAPARSAPAKPRHRLTTTSSKL